MTNFFKNLEFGQKILLLIALAAVLDFFALGFATRTLDWSNGRVAVFVISHMVFVSAFIITGVRITSEHALVLMRELGDGIKTSPATQPAMTPTDELTLASELLKRDAQQWREEQGLELSGLPHREEVGPEPVSFVAEEPDHEGPGGDEDGPWFEGVHPDPDEPAEEQVDPSTADGPFASGTRQDGPLGERTW